MMKKKMMIPMSNSAKKMDSFQNLRLENSEETKMECSIIIRTMFYSETKSMNKNINTTKCSILSTKSFRILISSNKLLT
jgi:hypothetical protein